MTAGKRPKSNARTQFAEKNRDEHDSTLLSS